MLRRAPKPPDTCEHLTAAAGAEEPEPVTPGRCQDCAEPGETWRWCYVDVLLG